MTQKTNYIEEQNAQRASAKDIDQAIVLLQSAFSDGRLNEREFDDRMAKAVHIKTHNDILSLVHDLSFTDKMLRRLRSSITAFCSGIEQKGRFSIPPKFRVRAIMGGCVIDLSEARFENAVTEIFVTAFMGGVEILVPRGVRVEVDGTALFGGFAQNIVKEELPSYAPTIYIRASAFMGGGEVKSKR